jgi:hypothetical protein
MRDRKYGANILDPFEFYTTIRVTHKYDVTEMNHNQFLDLTQDREVIVEKRKTGKEGEEVNWLKIK